MGLQKEEIVEVVKDTLTEGNKEIQNKITDLENEVKELKARPTTISNITVNDKVEYPIGKAIRLLGKSYQTRRPISDLIEEEKKEDSTSTSAFVEKKIFQDQRNKTLLAGVFDSGGLFIPEDVSPSIYPLLREASVVRSAGTPVQTWGAGNRTFRKNATSYTAYWVGEAANTTESDATYGALIGNVKKLTALTVISNDVLRYSNSNIDAEIQGNLIKTIATKEDEAFLSGTGTASQPKGMTNWAGNTRAMSTDTDASSRMSDLLECISDMAADKVPMTNLAWFMNNTIFYGLQKSYMAAEKDQISWAKQLGEQKRLCGIPVYVSGNVPTQTVILADLDQLIIGEGLGMTVDFVPNATVTTSGGIVYGAQSDQSIIRGITAVDFLAIYADAISTITSVTWA